MRVLFVDDEALIVLLATSWLEDLGCEVETALNATEALAKLGSDPYVEVLLTDVICRASQDISSLNGPKGCDRA